MEQVNLYNSINTGCKDIWEVLAHPIVFRGIFLFALKRERDHPSYENKDRRIEFLKNTINEIIAFFKNEQNYIDFFSHMDILKERYANEIKKARIGDKEIASAIIAINTLKNFENQTSIDNKELLVSMYMEDIKNYTLSVLRTKKTA